MSGKPNPEGVAQVVALLDRCAACDEEIDELQERIARDTARVRTLTGNRDGAWAEHLALMRQMDVDSPGNTGFERRAAWFLVEMRRQIKEEGEK